MTKLETIDHINLDNFEPNEYIFQQELTERLDKVKGDFSQNTINEIVLWKTNRYSKLNNDTLKTLNKIEKTTNDLNIELTKETLKKLLNTKGIKIAMASSILRFKNPNIYQIIDQRVYRLIYNNTDYKKLENKIDKTEIINLYIEYLQKLKNVCIKKNIKFSDADRILYIIDKKINKDCPIIY